MKVAIVTPVVSHFEVPLFRILAGSDQFETMVFSPDDRLGESIDPDYRQKIHWGDDLTAGYAFTHTSDTHAGLRSAALGWKPDAVLQYGYSWPGALRFLTEAKLKGAQVVHRGTISPYRDVRQPAVTQLARPLRQFVLRRFDAHHYGGSYSLKVLTGAGVPKSRCYFVPYSIDTPRYASMADDPAELELAKRIRAERGWAETDEVVLFIGQHAWVKGPDIAIEIAARAQRLRPNLRLVMVGQGPMHAALRQLAERELKPGSWSLPGFVPSLEATAYYLASDLVLFPSRYDTWARAVNEAMLCRRPCLVSEYVGAGGDLVETGANGYVVSGLAPDHYVRPIVDFFAADRARRAAMGENARRKAFDFSYEAHVDELFHSLSDRRFKQVA